ncbi:MAG TPA: hypothetical protein VLV83_11435 [Acidobacteriota bacterium]|nr:hypothetical protein [Acidobacteriota bacterium]
MMQFPGRAIPSTSWRLFPDSQDSSVTYLDTGTVRRRNGAQGTAPGASSLELAWQPRDEDLDKAGREVESRQVSARPWEQVRALAWTADQTEAELRSDAQARGSSLTLEVPRELCSRGGLSLELRGQAQLSGAVLKGRAEAAVVDDALQRLDVDADLLRWATLAEVLTGVLGQLLDQRRITLAVESVSLPLGALQDLRQAGLMEWARRIAKACGDACLALPAAQAPSLRLSHDLDLSIDWQEGDLIELSEVRTLRPEGVESPEIKLTPGPALPVTVEAAGDWGGFDFVTLHLKQGGESAKVSLTPDEPRHIWRPRRDGKLEVAAVGMAKGYAVPIPLPVRRQGSGVGVTLRPLKEQALLVRIPRRTLRLTGPLQVELHHPALAVQLTPEEGPVILDAETGELATISGVYRALLWKDEEEHPYRLQVEGSCGRFPLEAQASGGSLELDPSLLHVLPPAGHRSGRLEVEASWLDQQGRRRPLGKQPIEPGGRILWCRPPGSRLELRTFYPEAPGGGYRTPWQEAPQTGAGTAPAAAPRRVAAMLSPQAVTGLEIEAAAAKGRGGTVGGRLSPGQACSLEFPAPSGDQAWRYRIRPAQTSERDPTETEPAETPEGWSDWQQTSENVIKLAPHEEPRGENPC